MQRNLHRLPGGGVSANSSSSELRTSILRMSNRPYDGKIAGMYDLEETLGRGHFAVVKLARHVFTGQKVAVKVIDKSKLDDVSKAHLFQEVRCMKLVQHPNVVRLYQVIDTATKLYLVLELGDGGDLYEYIIRHEQGLPEDMAKDYFRQIVRAISYCHQLHVVHRDLKPENVVFFKKLGVVKLTDFGFSNKFYPGQKLETSCGSLAYSAPEILLGDSYDAPAVDVWSLGVILYMLVCGQAPFQEANDSETLTMIMDCKYNVPAHVSTECRELISRMLVKNPEKRATLKEISVHPWLKDGGNDENSTDTLALPLVSREQLSEEDHNLIVQKMVNGNIATKEDIQDCLDKNEYNHITATYYLLAEMKLKSKRLDLVNKNKRPENLSVSNSLATPKRENGTTTLKPCLLNVPRTPGDLPQRSRKCSIVQEDEEEEDVCSGREELGPTLNRRGSRSEGRLNLALQDRLAETERRKPAEKIPEVTQDKRLVVGVRQKVPNIIWQSSRRTSTASKEPTTTQSDVIPTTIITDCSTIASPITRINEPVDCSSMPKYKTMPSPTRNSTSSNLLQLNEIFEENVDGDNRSSTTPTLQSSGNRFIKRTPYEQRKSKFHKSRTTSCSSSDASDDDSEKRKKRQNKLNPTSSAKTFQGRRDSHDDSSDSQEPSTGAGTGGGDGGSGSCKSSETVNSQNGNGGGGGGGRTTENDKKSSNESGGSRKTGMSGSNVLNRRHKLNRRRGDETRLRESQSLNRITEVQEDNTHALVISTTVVSAHGPFTPKVKGLGARILQSFSISTKKQQTDDNDEKMLCNKNNTNSTSRHISRKDTLKSDKQESNNLMTDKKKLKILGKYFQVHKKLCIPLPVIFNKNNNNNNRLYKAQSCGSLVRDKIGKKEPVLRCRQRAVSVFRNSFGIEEDDVNRNENEKRRKSATVVQLNNVCNELTGICAIHLGQTTKRSFC